jgi:hypothetical protein
MSLSKNLIQKAETPKAETKKKGKETAEMDLT